MPKRRNYLINRRFQIKYTIMIVGVLMVVMVAAGIGFYMGMWGSIIENFSKFKVSQNLENARRIADYEKTRYAKGDYRLEKIFREAELLSEMDRLALKEALRSVNRSLITKILILFAVIFLAGIFISHKIAGPMYRIEKSAEAIRDGDLRVSFKLRKSDEMKSAASVLEEMVDSLQGDIEKIKTANQAIESKVESASGHMDARDVADLRKPVGQIAAVLAKYKT